MRKIIWVCLLLLLVTTRGVHSHSSQPLAWIIQDFIPCELKIDGLEFVAIDPVDDSDCTLGGGTFAPHDCICDGTTGIYRTNPGSGGGGGAPSGAAGGSLDGTYPNPGIATDAVSADELNALGVESELEAVLDFASSITPGGPAITATTALAIDSDSDGILEASIVSTQLHLDPDDDGTPEWVIDGDGNWMGPTVSGASSWTIGPSNVAPVQFGCGKGQTGSACWIGRSGTPWLIVDANSTAAVTSQGWCMGSNAAVANRDVCLVRNGAGRYRIGEWASATAPLADLEVDLLDAQRANLVWDPADVLVDSNASGGGDKTPGDLHYFATLFNSGPITEVGVGILEIKQSLSTPTTKINRCWIYTNGAGPVPLVAITPTLDHTDNSYHTLESSGTYAEVRFMLGVDLTASTDYWFVCQVDLEGSAVVQHHFGVPGGENYATSTNGTAWIVSSNQAAVFKVVGRVDPAIVITTQDARGAVVTTESDIAIRAESTNSTAIYGTSTHQRGGGFNSRYREGSRSSSEESEGSISVSVKGWGFATQSSGAGLMYGVDLTSGFDVNFAVDLDGTVGSDGSLRLGDSLTDASGDCLSRNTTEGLYFDLNCDQVLDATEYSERDFKRGRMENTDTPWTCTSTETATMYYDTSLSEPCFCNGTAWRQFDGGGAC